MSNIVITTPEEAQDAVRLIDDRLAAVEQKQADLIDRVATIRTKARQVVKAVKYLAVIHMPQGNGRTPKRGSGHVRMDTDIEAIAEMDET